MSDTTVPSRRARVEALFEAALDRPEPERAAFVAAEAGDDAPLAAEVSALLAAHARAGVLDVPVAPPRREVPPPVALGPYRVVAELGRGGMAMVYVGERDDGQFRQRVAIKLLRAGLGHPALVARFEVERQILAALAHPGIARLFDGGVAPDGRPFLVMELVDGVPIDEHCDRREAGIEERLRLFVAVARAVHHAHRRLVVHRDLKPTNILVTPQGEVKLLDFGIAKLLDPAAAPGAPVTESGLRPMTPEYAAPEQLTGEPITTACDVYQLGVVLYELLTGRRPIRRDGRSPQAWERAVLTEEPPAPSAIIGAPPPPVGRDGHAPEEPAVVARRRGLTPGALARRLAGDLDRIALMALRKEPERRYASAEQFAEDVERHLAGLPVLAQGDGGGYRARKFLQRHWRGFTAAAVACAALAGGTLVATWQARVASRERDRAEALARRAEAARRESDEVAGFLVGLFEADGPDQGTGAGTGDSVTARELLARGLARVSRLEGEPRVQARLLGAVARVYERLGLFDRALDLAQQALARSRAAGGDGLEVATRLEDVARMYRQLGQLDSAEHYYRSALAHARESGGDTSATVAVLLGDLGRLSVARGGLARAESLYRASVDRHRALRAPDSVRLALAYEGLGAVLRRRGRFLEAEANFSLALALRRAAQGPAHPDVATPLLQLARVRHYDLGRPAEGERLAEEALAIQRAALGPTHWHLAPALAEIGQARLDQGDTSGAEARFTEALALRRGAFGPLHPSVAESKDHLAQLWHAMGRLREADTLYASALRDWRTLLGDRHPTVAGTAMGLASVRWDRGLRASADSLVHEALAIREATYGRDHPLVADCLARLARQRVALRDFAAAEPLLIEALAIRRRAYGDGHGMVIATARDLVALYEAAGRPEAAAPYRELAAR